MKQHWNRFRSFTKICYRGTDLSVDLYSEDLLRLRAGELHRGVGGVLQGQTLWVAYLTGVLVLTHAAVRFLGHPLDPDDGVGVRAHQHFSATCRNGPFTWTGR